jgi:hypothetical protein
LGGSRRVFDLLTPALGYIPMVSRLLLSSCRCLFACQLQALRLVPHHPLSCQLQGVGSDSVWGVPGALWSSITIVGAHPASPRPRSSWPCSLFETALGVPQMLLVDSGWSPFETSCPWSQRPGVTPPFRPVGGCDCRCPFVADAGGSASSGVGVCGCRCLSQAISRWL